MITIKINDKEVFKDLANFNSKLQKQIRSKALKKSSQQLVSSAKSLTPKKTGKLKQSIKYISINNRSVDVSIGVIKPYFGRYSKKKTVNEYYGRFVHEGTKTRKAKKNKVFVFENNGQTIFTKKTEGLKPNPFLMNAFTAKNRLVLSDFIKLLIDEINKITK